MWDFPYDSLTAIRTLLEEEQLALSKKFGQNFLLSDHVLKEITRLVDAKEGSTVWEVGPGIGALTSHLLKTKAHVTAFEIDYGFIRVLTQRAFGDEKNFHLVSGDVLKTYQIEYQRNGTPSVVCGNLPYNIGSLFIATIIEQGIHPKRMVFTLQKEVAHRLQAQSGTKAYSTLSILTQCFYDVSIVMNLSSGHFYPPPEVASSVILLTQKEKPLLDDGITELFFPLIRDLFAQRRKTIKNNLLNNKEIQRIGNSFITPILEEANIDEKERSENLSIETLIALAQIMKRYAYPTHEPKYPYDSDSN
ncbi:MAG: 16S rRNA (adenine(1518)-N(6)/adenine(1519)-N(6))-dimethyltransferase RsmA [Sphaerochaetaceae bacterium]